MIRYTQHGSRRAQERGVRQEYIEAAIMWGSEKRQRGSDRIMLVVTRRAVREAAREGVNIEDARGAVVIMSEDRVVTAYWLNG